MFITLTAKNKYSIRFKKYTVINYSICLVNIAKNQDKRKSFMKWQIFEIDDDKIWNKYQRITKQKIQRVHLCAIPRIHSIEGKKFKYIVKYN